MKDNILLHHIPVILYMIRTFFDCYGNQIKVNAPLEICIFSLSDILESKFS